MLTSSGSRRKFYHKKTDALIICHAPHPSPDVDKECIADVVARLRAFRVRIKWMDTLKYKNHEGTAECDMARGVLRGKILFINDVVT